MRCATASCSPAAVTVEVVKRRWAKVAAVPPVRQWHADRSRGNAANRQNHNLVRSGRSPELELELPKVPEGRLRGRAA